VEVVTNAIEHAYAPEAPGTIELDATLGSDGSVTCLITDHGTWRPPDPADADRGHGLMVAGHVVDTLLVGHPAAGGTTVTPRRRLPLGWSHVPRAAGQRGRRSRHVADTSMDALTARMPNAATIVPDAMKPIRALFGSISGGGVPQATLDLVHLRVSQVNGCSP